MLDRDMTAFDKTALGTAATQCHSQRRPAHPRAEIQISND
jgi:hypothetical protein